MLCQTAAKEYHIIAIKNNVELSRDLHLGTVFVQHKNRNVVYVSPPPKRPIKISVSASASYATLEAARGLALERHRRAFHLHLSPALLFVPEGNEWGVILQLVLGKWWAKGGDLHVWLASGGVQLGRSLSTLGWSLATGIDMPKDEVQSEGPNLHC